MCRRLLLTTSLHQKLKERLEERSHSLRGELAQEERRLEEQANRLRAEVNRILDFVKSFDAGSFPAALQNLQQSFEQASKDLRDAEYRLEQLRRSGRDSVRVPTIDDLSEIVLAVEARFKDDPTAAREALRTMLADGRPVMNPSPTGPTVPGASLLHRLAASAPEKPEAPRARGLRGFGCFRGRRKRWLRGSASLAVKHAVKEPFRVVLAA